MDINLKQYEKLGPFEIKDFVAKLATKSAQENSLSYLNAGRGNPNWVATEPREGAVVGGIIRLRAHLDDPAALLPLTSAVLYAVAMIAIRMMSRSEAAAFKVMPVSVSSTVRPESRQA